MIQKVTVKSWKSYEQHTPKGNEKMKKQEQQKFHSYMLPVIFLRYF